MTYMPGPQNGQFSMPGQQMDNQMVHFFPNVPTNMQGFVYQNDGYYPMMAPNHFYNPQQMMGHGEMPVPNMHPGQAMAYQNFMAQHYQNPQNMFYGGMNPYYQQ